MIEPFAVTPDGTIVMEEAALLYSLAALFGGGGRQLSALGVGANIVTEYDESPVKRPSGGRRTPRSSKEKVAFGFERPVNRAVGAADEPTGGGGRRTPRGSKDEIAISPISAKSEVAWDSVAPSAMSLDISSSPSISATTPPQSSPTADALPVSISHRKGFAFGFAPLTSGAGDAVGDGGGGAGYRKPRGSKSKMAPISAKDGVAPSSASLHDTAEGLVLPASAPPLPQGCSTVRGSRWRWLVANRQRASEKL